MSTSYESESDWHSELCQSLCQSANGNEAPVRHGQANVVPGKSHCVGFSRVISTPRRSPFVVKANAIAVGGPNDFWMQVVLERPLPRQEPLAIRSRLLGKQDLAMRRELARLLAIQMEFGQTKKLKPICRHVADAMTKCNKDHTPARASPFVADLFQKLNL
jgi:hypothetical protein